MAQAALLAGVIDRAFLGGASPGELQGAMLALGAVIVLRAALSAGFEVSGWLGALRAMSGLRGQLVDHLLPRPTARAARRADRRTGRRGGAGIDSLESYFARYLPQLVLAALAPRRPSSTWPFALCSPPACSRSRCR